MIFVCHCSARIQWFLRHLFWYCEISVQSLTDFVTQLDWLGRITEQLVDLLTYLKSCECIKAVLAVPSTPILLAPNCRRGTVYPQVCSCCWCWCPVYTPRHLSNLWVYCPDRWSAWQRQPTLPTLSSLPFLLLTLATVHPQALITHSTFDLAFFSWSFVHFLRRTQTRMFYGHLASLWPRCVRASPSSLSDFFFRFPSWMPAILMSCFIASVGTRSCCSPSCQPSKSCRTGKYQWNENFKLL